MSEPTVRVTGKKGGGFMLLRRPAPHVELVSGEGHAEAIYLSPLLAMRERIIAECGVIALFDDLENIDGYDTEIRVGLTAWARKRKNQIVAFHILHRSRLMAMGVSVANLALGSHIHTHQRRSTFEAALALEAKSVREVSKGALP